MNKNSKIYVAGHLGLVGSAITKTLKGKGYTNIIGRSIDELDLLNQHDVAEFFRTEKPEYVILAAAKVGGIVANSIYRGQFIYENLQIQNNIIHQSYLNEVKKLLFLGSTCIYPREAPQPMIESCLLTDELEYTNEPYAIAKIAGLKMCESYNLQYGTNFIAVMPTNLYGPNDNFNLETSHVLPALIRKIHLGRCLEENNWDAIRQDLNKRPIEKITGKHQKEEIINILSKYGIQTFPSPSVPQSLSLSVSQSLRPSVSSSLSPSVSSSLSPSVPPSLRPSVTVELWGTGTPLREFLWSEEMADACVFIMEKIDFKDILNHQSLSPLAPQSLSPSVSQSLSPSVSQSLSPSVPPSLSPLVPQSLCPPVPPSKEIKNTHINIGTGKEITIKQLAYLIKNTIGYKGELHFNTAKPDGTMRKLTDPSRLHQLGWHHKIDIEEGVKKMYDWYLK